MTTKVLQSLMVPPSSIPLLPCACESLECGRDDEVSVSVSVSVLDLLVDMIRKSLIISGCGNGIVDECNWVMEIGNPTNVRHVSHVTFDNFDGFLGLPDELQPDVPSRPLSASVSVFGVAAESMQLSYDQRGNSVPTILLMMQQRLYALGGLRTEGIFRINGENGEEEYVRDRLKHGTMPDGVDVHCLAGLIKAWFRELPAGIMDSLSPEKVLQSRTREQCLELVKQLPLIEYALLDWALELMADVAQMEHLNKMNAYSIAVVFAPNMSQMADPPTALMHAVQLTNFLKLLTEIKLEQRRRESMLESPTRSDKKSDIAAANKAACYQTSQSNKPHSKRGSIRSVNDKEKHVRINSRPKKLEAWR